MRFLACAAAFGSLLAWQPALAQAPAPDAVLASFAGRWHCAVAGAHQTERYYFVTGGEAAYVRGRAEITENDGSVTVAFETIKPLDVGFEIATREGTGAATAAGGTLEFRGHDPDSKALVIRYTVTPAALQRVVSVDGATVRDERCSRVEEPPFPTQCAVPNAPAKTLHVVEPPYPETAGTAAGRVFVMVTLDAHSRVFGARITRSDNAAFNDPAVRAAVFSTYQTRIKDCVPVAGDYIFTVDFSRP